MAKNKKYFKKSDARQYVDYYPEKTVDELVLLALRDFQPKDRHVQDFIARAMPKFEDAVKAAKKAHESDPEEVIPIIGGEREAPDARRQRATGRRFLFTMAQSNTLIHEGFFRALQSFMEDTGAELHVSRVTYNKKNHGKSSVKPGSRKGSDGDDAWFDDRLADYFSDESLQIADDLIWSGELCILPTAVKPLTGLDNYARGASNIVPAPKIQMVSGPKHGTNNFRVMMTTGAVTMRNYIQKRAGQIAEFHHVHAATFIDMDEDGNWWPFQIVADTEGNFQHIDTIYRATGEIIRGVRAECVTHGDIHVEKFDHPVLGAVWGEGGLIATTQPFEQHFHDLIDFSARNHHNIKDPHFLVKQRQIGERVEGEVREGAALLNLAYKKGIKSVVIVSNHDRAIYSWLKNTAGFYDAANAAYWCRLNAIVMMNLERGLYDFDVFEHELRANANTPFKFVTERDSHKVANASGGIECGLHGHVGPNGSRGSAQNLNNIGTRVNMAHTHTPTIHQGVYVAGVLGKLDMGYNIGPSSWAQASILTYTNGKRTMVFFRKINGKVKWRP
jgi:hypothetical protein